MALHPNFPSSPYETLLPEVRWFPAAEELRATAYEKLLPPLVARIREEVKAWRDSGYEGASPTSKALLRWWFETDHLIEQADGTQAEFRYYFAQREAVESVSQWRSVKLHAGLHRPNDRWPNLAGGNEGPGRTRFASEDDPPPPVVR